jgi:hypothetical protein
MSASCASSFFCCVASGVLRLNPGRLKSDEGAFSYRPGEDAAASEASSKFYERSEYFFREAENFFAAQRQNFFAKRRNSPSIWGVDTR